MFGLCLVYSYTLVAAVEQYFQRRWMMAFVAKCYQILVNAVNVLLVINAIYLSNSISKLVSSVPAIKPEYRSVCKQAHISNFQMQQLFYSHLFCKGCLIYCSGFATTWLSVGWSSVSAAFCREREMHNHTLLTISAYKMQKISFSISTPAGSPSVHWSPSRKRFAQLWGRRHICISPSCGMRPSLVTAVTQSSLNEANLWP